MTSETIIKALANLIHINNGSLPEQFSITTRNGTRTGCALTGIKFNTQQLLFLENHAPSACGFSEIEGFDLPEAEKD